MPALSSEPVLWVRRTLPRWGIAVVLASQVWLTSCTGTSSPAPAGAPGVVSGANASATATLASPIAVAPQESWRDARPLLRRSSTASPTATPATTASVDRNAKGTFHGGDLAGLRQQLDEIAGPRRDGALDHPGGREHRRLRHRRRLPRLGLPRLLGRRLLPPRPPLRHRGRAQGAGRRRPRPRHQGAARRGLQPRRLRLRLPHRPQDPRLVPQRRRSAPAARTT